MKEYAHSGRVVLYSLTETGSGAGSDSIHCGAAPR